MRVVEQPTLFLAATQKSEAEQSLDLGSNEPSKVAEVSSGNYMVSQLDDAIEEQRKLEALEAGLQPTTTSFESGATSRCSANALSCASGSETTSTSESSAMMTAFERSRAVGIDESLTSLMHCMTLAYSGKITSPKWNQFKGLVLMKKEKIRLNNLIWREYYMQCKFT